MTGVSVIIFNFDNSAAHLDHTLSAFFNTNTHSPVELIILDNQKNKNTAQTIAKYATKGFIRHIKASGTDAAQDKTQQPALIAEHSFNAFNKTRHQYLLCLYNNTPLTSDILPKAIKKIKNEKHSTIGILQNGATSPASQAETMGFLCRKSDFPSPDKLTRKFKDGFDTSINLHAEDIQPQPRTKTTPSSLNVLFVNKGRMSTNSGYHIQYYANMTSCQGASVLVAVPKIDENEQFMYDSFQVQTYAEIEKNGPAFPDGRGPDIVHAWTPRERVRKFCLKLANKYSFKTIVHLEDNEEYLTENTVGRPYEELAALPPDELDQLIPEDRFHPIRGWQWLKQADSLSLIIDTLQRFNPDNKPTIILPAPVDERLFYPRPINYELRKSLNIPDNHVVLAYIGNVHPLKKHEASALYQAVAMLNEQGVPTTLLRTGENYVSLGENEEKYRQFEKSLGWVERTEIPNILAAADILVQPGWPGPFDDQRIPAKLPEYFAMGRPVILPRANLGLKVEHGKEGYVLEKADAENIARAVREVWQDDNLKERLAVEAMRFYRGMIYHPNIGESITTLYNQLKQKEAA